ncbi:hypothetical protein BDN72DRAFT_964072, partial [Pluteus cervinus]
MQDPRLPPELERKIFLIALEIHGSKDVRNLLLIAKRVNDWLFPRVFEVVILDSERKFPIPFTFEKFERYGPHIRSLLLTSVGIGIQAQTDLATEYISCCPNVTNLSIRARFFDDDHLRDAISSLPLTRLSIHISSILQGTSPQLFQLFANLTHLHLFSSFLTPDDQPQSLRLFFPSLTHIALTPAEPGQGLRAALTGWNKLRVVVI